MPTNIAAKVVPLHIQNNSWPKHEQAGLGVPVIAYSPPLVTVTIGITSVQDAMSPLLKLTMGERLVAATCIKTGLKYASRTFTSFS